MTRLLAIRQVSYALRLTSRRRALFGSRRRRVAGCALIASDPVAGRRRPSPGRSIDDGRSPRRRDARDARRTIYERSNQFGDCSAAADAADATGCKLRPRAANDFHTATAASAGGRRTDVVDRTRRQLRRGASSVLSRRCRRQIMILFHGGRRRPGHDRGPAGRLIMPPRWGNSPARVAAVVVDASWRPTPEIARRLTARRRHRASTMMEIDPLRPISGRLVCPSLPGLAGRPSLAFARFLVPSLCANQRIFLGENYSEPTGAPRPPRAHTSTTRLR